ncbi:MAG: mevalonate kinase [Candidatus Levybacteria bacterium]|nr:mevalonate kinase [Candidatus Levybacteria bacterium]
MNNISFSVPGKIHLIGEHTVVYGKPALLSAIDLRVSVSIKKSNQKRRISHDGQKVKTIIEHIIKQKFSLAILPAYAVSIQSQLPSGAGLGSSAAVSAAYSAALLDFLEIPWTKQLVNELAFEADKIFNGNPSGGDNATVVYGGMLQFQKGKEMENMNQSTPHTFMLINSGKPDETTAEMVEKVAVFGKRYPDVFKKILQDQEILTTQMRAVLEEKKEDRLFEIMKMAQNNLDALGVVSEKARLIMYSLNRLGIAAKISGAGGFRQGAGMILCLAKDTDVLIQFAKTNNFEYKRISIGVQGLRKGL